MNKQIPCHGLNQNKMCTKCNSSAITLKISSYIERKLDLFMALLHNMHAATKIFNVNSCKTDNKLIGSTL